MDFSHNIVFYLRYGRGETLDVIQYPDYVYTAVKLATKIIEAVGHINFKLHKIFIFGEK